MRELKLKDTSWVSLINPTKEDVDELGQRFPQIHPLVLEELLTPTIRPRVENYDHHLYMVLHFPVFTPGYEKSISHELDIILMANTIITVHYDELSTIENFWHECESRESKKEHYGKTPLHLLYYLLRRFFSNSLKELDQIQTKIDEVEEQVFSGHEKEILEIISYLRRDVVDFRRALKPQHLTLQSLETQGVLLYGESVRPFLTDLIGEYLKVWDLLENHKETLDTLYETNNSLLTSKINEIMRVFTILAFISFIPTAIANIYGMNLTHIPLAGDTNAFWQVLGIMTLLTGLVYLALKWKKLV
ncbi:MAG: magnesium transporter CorA family protein [Candidatus Sungbacteria bacterium]|nr:magnesium transporter CorA family protein [Candidatus Sungbacteria bacterium]